MNQSEDRPLDRRNFIKMAAGGAAALAAGAQLAGAQAPEPMRAALSAAEPTDVASETPLLTTERPGADFMVDVLKSLDFEFVTSNPGSSFRALQESFVNYGKNKTPEWITCMHEEASVAMAQAYAKIEGKPMLVMAHGTVGLQHAAMAVYNAFVDRVPVYIVLGNTLDATDRRPGAEWSHSVQDAAAMVRDYIKWDDTPQSLAHFAESAVRAYKIAMTPPMEPVVLVADSDLQEAAIDRGRSIRIPKLTIPEPPTGDPSAVREIAKLLVNAENPMVLGGRTNRTQKGMDLLNELSELLQAEGANARTADIILALETDGLWGSLNSMTDQQERTTRSNIRPGTKVLTINATDLFMKSNYQDFQRFQEVDLALAASAEATLPSLIEEIKRQMTAARRQVIQDRGAKLVASRAQAAERQRQQAALVWNLSPISSTRISYELWEQVKNRDWAFVNGNPAGGAFPFTKHYQRIGGSGGGGQGYGGPASVGGALANRKYGRISLSIQNDGDLMYSPGALWTAAHHRIPLLSIMNNNRAYHQEVMHLQRMACRHNRDLTTANIGTTIEDPNIDYAKLAQSMGWYAEGPITNPNDVGPAIQRALAVVEKGQPALLDTVMQPR
jgi:thiamine pyrophosphate-dependent acetolactate synthase large subunit-like protein